MPPTPPAAIAPVSAQARRGGPVTAPPYRRLPAIAWLAWTATLAMALAGTLVLTLTAPAACAGVVPVDDPHRQCAL